MLLFGRKLVPPWAHFVAALMVALGTLFSSFWILAANSWMQTPAGYEIIDGRFFPTDWIDDRLQPVLPLPPGPHRCRLLRHHRLRRAGRRRLADPARDDSSTRGGVMLSMTLWLLLVLVPLQIFLGDQHGLNTREHQPAKLAAIEARWETGAPRAADPVRHSRPARQSATTSPSRFRCSAA